MIAAASQPPLLSLISTMVWGLDSWSAFARQPAHGPRIYGAGDGRLLQKPQPVLDGATVGWIVAVGYAAQLVGILVALLLVWRSAGEKANLRAVGVCAAVALSTPYLFDYDMAVVGLGGAFLFAEGRDRGFLPFERSILAFIWIAPWVSRPAAQFLALPLGPAAMLLLAWVAWRRVRQSIAIPPLTCNVCPVT